MEPVKQMWSPDRLPLRRTLTMGKFVLFVMKSGKIAFSFLVVTVLAILVLRDHILFPGLHLLVFPYQALSEKIPKIPSKPFPLPPHYRPLTPPQKTPPPNPSCHRENAMVRYYSSNLALDRSYLVSSPSAAEECFTKNDVVFANRPKLLAGKYLGYDYTTVGWAPYGPHWRNLRRIASIEILSTNRLEMFTPIRVDEVRYLLNRLHKGSKNGDFHMVDMKSAFFELTLNNMMRMIAGKRYYDENNTADLEETRKFKETVTEAFQLSGATNYGDFVPFLKWVGVNGLEKRLQELQKKRDKFLQDLIEKHRRGRSDSCSEERRKTMIDVLLSLQENEPEYYTDKIIRGFMIEAFEFPSGTMLLVNIWAIQNDPMVWAEPTKFKPERFLGPERPRDGFMFMPFGFGRRGCAGEGLAMRVVSLVLGSLIQCFEWEREGEEMVDMSEGVGLITPKAWPLVCKCRWRQAMVNLLSQL
ncbi:cytochrome P450, family 81, subfamily F, polypeptide 3 [Actinidia rufa]|uniref:Cytochrome P450, family 81, subfamily F, polypeptide 3 n=1 Tax=Actinidia rufa TaxID=165716 RepID=A0A7J0FBC6_9ERIC|nr:cytochrome P450, family 81, subfamily F, polypeptide 3 [Actinidia rufa]